MSYLKDFSYIVSAFLIIASCEIENNPVEILSFSSNDSVAVSGQGIMLYCEATDGDGDKLIFSWETSDGPFSTKPDSTEWIPPNDEGTFLLTCKVSDGIGSSDTRTLSIRVYPPTPVPLNGLEWTLTDIGLLNGTNSSNENNTGEVDFWDGNIENAHYGWNLTAQDTPDREISQSLLVKVENSADCVEENGNPATQAGTATANIQVTGSSPITLEVEFSGMGETQSRGYDKIQFNLDGIVIGSGEAPGGVAAGGDGCISDSVLVTPAAPQSLDPGPHTLIINFTTQDGQFHVDAYYEIKLKLLVPR